MYKKLISTIALGLIVGATTINVNANPKLSDINGHWANKEIQDFVSKGYLKGYTDGTFKPDNSITREEAAKIIVSIKNSEDVNLDKLNNFLDGYMVSDWAKKYVEGAIESGYIKGDTNGKIKPVSNITRAESVSMISRVSQHADILPNEAPVVTADDVTIKQGENFSYAMLNASATDKEDGDISHSIKFDGTVNTSKPGRYTVTLTVTDTKGASASIQVIVTVEEVAAESYNPNSSEFKSAVASNMISLVNSHRAANGAPALTMVGRLNTSANGWSAYMANNGFFDHTAPNGNTSNSLFPDCAPISGENIALTQFRCTGDMQQDARNLANELFGMWKNSSGHNATMLRSFYVDFGFGMHAVKVGDTGTTYSIYATQHFSGKIIAPNAPVDEKKEEAKPEEVTPVAPI